MNRVKIEYGKGIIMGVMGLFAFVAMMIGGGPSAYPASMILLPIVLLLLTAYFFWKAGAIAKERQE